MVCAKFAGHLLGLFNILTAVIGAIFIWIGYKIRYETEHLITKVLPKVINGFDILSGNNDTAKNIDFSALTATLDTRVGLAFLIMGCIIVAISIFGILAGCCRVLAFLVPYIIIMFMILLSTITLTILFATNAPIVEQGLERIELKILNEHYTWDSKGYGEVWDKTQETLKCCGVRNGTDFTYTFKKAVNGTKVPKSCCKTKKVDCTANPTADNSYINRGCSAVIWALVKNQYTNVVIGLSILDAVIFLPFMFAVIVRCYYVDKDY